MIWKTREWTALPRTRVNAVAIGAAGAFVAVGSIAIPAAASADEVVERTETTISLVPDCDSVTPEGRDYLNRHRPDLCRFDGKERGVVNGNCGTSTVYVDKLGSGRGRVSWGLFSKKGAMTSRNLTVTWGTAGGGQFWDLSPMATLAYSNSKNVNGKGKFSAAVSGSVTVASQFLTCKIPRHQTNTLTL